MNTSITLALKITTGWRKKFALTRILTPLLCSKIMTHIKTLICSLITAKRHMKTCKEPENLPVLLIKTVVHLKGIIMADNQVQHKVIRVLMIWNRSLDCHLISHLRMLGYQCHALYSRMVIWARRVSKDYGLKHLLKLNVTLNSHLKVNGSWKKHLNACSIFLTQMVMGL